MNCVKLPIASNPEEAKRAFDHMENIPQGSQELLEAIFGNSPYLTKLIQKNSDFFEFIIKNGSFEAFNQTIKNLPDVFENKEDLMRHLRLAKQKIALLTAIADITKEWTLEEVTKTLSDFAKLCVEMTVSHLVATAHKKGNLEQSTHDGVVIMGLGKIGGDELNYSSDIDLIILFDKEKVPYCGRLPIQRFFTTFSQELVQILQERTGDGYVFRVDLRIRPDPLSTPPAIALNTALNYYHTVGQNWERAALIKAVPIAGDMKMGFGFLRGVRSYIWRKHLDFESIRDIHSIKRQMNIKLYNQSITVRGQNIKVGIGGIREIEFYAQTQQLIWGGRTLKLRAKSTCKALLALAEEGRIEQKTADDLIEKYKELRELEHRLQMINDQQTHTIPEDEAELYRLACFMGFDNVDDFKNQTRASLTLVHKYYEELFEDSPNLSVGEGRLVFTGVENDPETLKTLKKIGFKEPERVSEIIRMWHFGKRNATKTTKSRELLTELIPLLLKALAHTVHPDDAFLNFDAFIAHAEAGVQFFSLLYSNPELLYLVADIMGNAPHLGETLGKHPYLLDSVLLRKTAPLDKPSLKKELHEWLETEIGEI